MEQRDYGDETTYDPIRKWSLSEFLKLTLKDVEVTEVSPDVELAD